MDSDVTPKKRGWGLSNPPPPVEESGAEVYSERVRAWHVENVRLSNAEMLAAGVCVMVSPHPEGPVRAEYIWHAKRTWGAGNELPVCARCCAQWRRNAAIDPYMAPELITSIRLAAAPPDDPVRLQEGNHDSPPA